MNEYRIAIDFSGENCYFNELQEYFSGINFKSCFMDDILYYSTSSEFVFYDFVITRINHDKKLVQLKAIRIN